VIAALQLLCYDYFDGKGRLKRTVSVLRIRLDKRRISAPLFEKHTGGGPSGFLQHFFIPQPCFKRSAYPFVAQCERREAAFSKIIFSAEVLR
jgi:hypothetical protein